MVKPSTAFRRHGLAAAAIAATAMAGLMPASAQAGTAGSALIASAVANLSVAGVCRATAGSGQVQTVGNAALISHAPVQALSALERMRMQQGEAVAITAAPAIGQASFGVECAGLTSITRTVPVERAGSATRPRAFLHSRILPVSKTAFDAEWQRVSYARNGGALRGAVAAIGGQGAARIAGVNAWVNRKVAYTPDAKLYGKADHWATAGETLARGKGDCEDYAIAKMAILAAMGVARSDMYLTIARDLVRQEDHAVLIVKHDGRSLMLDNATDELIDGDAANDFRPILSFSADRRYLHGY